MFAWIFRTFWPRWRFCGQNRRKGWCDVDPPPTNSFLLLGLLPLCHF